LLVTVQVIIDPLAAQGQGEGKAQEAQRLLSKRQKLVPIDVSVTNITYSAGADPTAVKAAFTASLEAYRRGIALKADPKSGNMYPVAY